MRTLLIVILFLLPTASLAQVRDSVFTNYEDYNTYVDEKIMARDFIPLIQTLGGRDEYTTEQLNSVNNQMRSLFLVDFENVARFREEDLGGGMRQEGRVYWTGEQYVFFYAMLHQREGELVVINFNLNSSISAIMEDF